MNQPPSLLWKQSTGPWRTRGACLAALQLAQARPVTAWPGAPWKDQSGYSLWHYWAASKNTQPAWMELMASEHQGSHDHTSHAGAHPWHLLAIRGNASCMQAWQKAFGSPDVGVWQGDGLLQCAVWSGDEDTLQLALTLDDAAINRRDAGRIPLLITALYRLSAASISRLLQAGADPDLTDSFGRSALHHAALLSDFTLLGELEDAGGDSALEDRDGHTPQFLMEQREGRGGDALRAHWARKYSEKLTF